MKKTVVTRHESYVQYALEIGLIQENEYEVVSHATPETVSGKDVIGILPHHLSCLTNTFTEIPMNIPVELRGKELSLEQMRLYASAPTTYQVKKIN